MDKIYIFNFIIFFVIVFAGFLAYYYWWMPSQENKAPVAQLEFEPGAENGDEANFSDTTGDSVGESSNNSGAADDSTGEPAEPETTDQGLQIDILQQGTGVETKNGDKLSVHYTGTLENGDVFDSSLGRGQPFDFTLGAGMVIKGWDMGLLGMKVGEKRKLTIPPELGYGSAGAGGVIPPNAVLIFEVELVGIQ